MLQGMKAVVWSIMAGSMAMAASGASAHEGTDGLEAYLAREARTYVCQKVGAAGMQTRLLPAPGAREVIGRGGYLGPCGIHGDRQALGNGTISTYVQLTPQGTPWGIGFEFPATMLDNLPHAASDGNNCFDLDNDGEIDIEGAHGREECVGGHERILDMPAPAAVAPFKWGLVNWNVHGHEPAHVYDHPHFDFHFYTQSLAGRNQIHMGPCALLVDCNDLATGTQPIPAGYMHQDFLDVGAVEGRMGNHLIDVNGHEWEPDGHFSQTWLFGSYGGQVTFWEPMITLAYLQARPFRCVKIKLPQRYQVAGWYPTEYCIRYRAERGEYTVSLEGFVARAAN
ncbi:hypothetical protein [Lysobacter fragariae]